MPTNESTNHLGTTVTVFVKINNSLAHNRRDHLLDRHVDVIEHASRLLGQSKSESTKLFRQLQKVLSKPRTLGLLRAPL